MVQAGEIVEQGIEKYTDCSYTSFSIAVSARLFSCNVLRVLTVVLTVSVLIWKTQDRMCRLGHPDESQDGLRRLYDEHFGRVRTKTDCAKSTNILSW